MPFFYFTLASPQNYGNFFNYLYGFWLNSFLEAFILTKLFSISSHVKIPWWFYILFTFTFPGILSVSFGGQLIRLFLFTILIYLLVVHRNVSYNKIAAYSTISYSFFLYIQAIVGPLVLMVLTMLFPAHSTEIKNYGSNIVLLLDFALAYLVVRKITPLIKSYVKTVVISRPILAWIINLLLISFYFVRSSFHFQLFKLGLLQYFLISALYWIMTYFVVKYVTKYNRYQQLAVNQASELDSLQTYTSHIEAMYDDLRRFRHDYKNLLLSLGDAIKGQDIKGVTTIYNQAVKPTAKNTEFNTSVLGRLAPVQSSAVKSLLYQKIMDALDKGIDVNVEIEKPIKPAGSVALTDLLRVISILFDNAIAAAQKADKPAINFSYLDDDQQKTQVMIVANSTKEERLDLNRLAKKSQFTLRPSKHGIGLRNLRQIIAEYPQMSNNRRSADYWFEQEIVIHQA